MDLKDKVVIVTGASSGLGKELAYQLSGKGSWVLLAARNFQVLGDIERDIQSRGGKAASFAVDVTKRDQVRGLVQYAISLWGRVDVLILNAAITHPSLDFADLSEEQARRVMETNFMGALYGVWEVIPFMQELGGGLLVFISSVIGKRGIPRSSIYCASKFALQGLTESIRLELCKKNIRVLTVCPPGIDTPFFRNNGRGEARTFFLHPVSKIARLILQACEKEKREVLPTWDARLLVALSFFFPRFADWAILKNKNIR